MVIDVRDHHPVAVPVRAGNLDPRQRQFDGAELREVDLQPRQEINATNATASRCAAAPVSSGRAPLAKLAVFPQDAALIARCPSPTESTRFARDCLPGPT
jgi:hypothetical protein